MLDFILFLDNQAEISLKPSWKPEAQIEQQVWTSIQSTTVTTQDKTEHYDSYNSGQQKNDTLQQQY